MTSQGKDMAVSVLHREGLTGHDLSALCHCQTIAGFSIKDDMPLPSLPWSLTRFQRLLCPQIPMYFAGKHWHRRGKQDDFSRVLGKKDWTQF